jgi:uncharacterized protein
MKFRALLPLFVLTSGLATAQTDPKLALAHQVIQAMHADRMVDRMQAQIEQMLGQMAPTAGASADDQARFKAVQSKVKALAMSESKGILDQMDRIYAEVYTEPELKAMEAFYTSPEGVAMVDKQPLVMQKLTPTILQMQRDLIPKIRAIVEQEQGGGQPGDEPAGADEAAPVPAN